MANSSPRASTLAAFDAAPPEVAERDVLTCCASRAFAKAIAAGRPYRERAAPDAAGDAVLAALHWGGWRGPWARVPRPWGGRKPGGPGARARRSATGPPGAGRRAGRRRSSQ